MQPQKLNVEAFLQEYEALCRKYKLYVSYSRNDHSMLSTIDDDFMGEHDIQNHLEELRNESP